MSACKCGRTSDVRVLRVLEYVDEGDFTPKDTPICGACVERHMLLCTRHPVDQLCMRDVGVDALQDEVELDLPEYQHACPMCALEVTRAMSAVDRYRIATVLEKGGWALELTERVEYLLGQRFANLNPVELVIYGLALSAGFAGLTPEEFLFELLAPEGSGSEATH